MFPPSFTYQNRTIKYLRFIEQSVYIKVKKIGKEEKIKEIKELNLRSLTL